MNEFELVDVILRLREQIDFLWNFYVTASAILIGWVFSSKMEWTRDRGLIIRGLFIVFALVNIFALYNEYALVQLAMMDLNSRAGSSSGFVYEFAQSGGLGPSTAMLIHAASDIVILILLNMRLRQVSSE